MAGKPITFEQVYSSIQQLKRKLDALVQILAEDEDLSDEALDTLEIFFHGLFPNHAFTFLRRTRYPQSVLYDGSSS